MEALRAGATSARLPGGLGNDLAPVTKGFVPEVRVLEEELLRAGAMGAAMSGSGTAVYGVFGSEADARAAVDELRAPFVGVCGPVTHGVETL